MPVVRTHMDNGEPWASRIILLHKAAVFLYEDELFDWKTIPTRQGRVD